MKSVKFFELIVFAFLASLLIFITGAKAQPIDFRNSIASVDASLNPTTISARGSVTEALASLTSLPDASLTGMITPATTPLPPDAVFPPRPLLVVGADVPAAADHTQIVVVDLVVEYSDGCTHRFVPNVQKNVSEIDIVPLGQKIAHGACPAVMRPKQESLELGLLQQGQYVVNVHSNDGKVIRNSLFIR